jgi:putative membrane protein
VNTALVIPTAASSGWGIGIGMVVCMLMMGVMMFAMMGHGRARDSRPRSWSGWWPGSPGETPVDVLERRFAEGEISVEEYRQRREILAHGTVTHNGAHEDEALTAPGPRERRQ